MKKLLVFWCLIQSFQLSAQVDSKVTVADTTKAEFSDSTILVSIVKPEFPGGNKALAEYLSNKIDYTPDAIIDKVEGTVIVSFIIYEDGSIRNIRVLKGIHPSLDMVAVEAIKGMPAWKAGTIKGKPSKQELSLPIKFTLPRKLKK